MDFDHLQCRTCSTSLPGGNLVDGLPPVAHIARECCRRRAALARTGPVKMSVFFFDPLNAMGRAALMDRALALHCI